MDGDTVSVFGVGSPVYTTFSCVRRRGTYSTFWYKEEDIHSVSSVDLGIRISNRILSFSIYDLTAGVDSCALALSA